MWLCVKWLCIRYKIPATPIPIRQQIVRLRLEDNLSIGAIAYIVKKSKRAVHGILKVYDDTGSCEARKSTGRPRKTSARVDDRAIAKIVKADRFETADTVSCEFNALSRQTVSRRLAECDLHVKTPAVKPIDQLQEQTKNHFVFANHVRAWSEEKW